MKINKKILWIIDLGLFIGFIVACIFDLTGLFWHQWLGVAVGLLASLHLIVHWSWVEAVTWRFFQRTSMQARLYYLIDAGLLLGFYLIVFTGLVISTWLSLPLGSAYLVLKDAHVIITISTLLLVVLKVAVHWRWVVMTARQHILLARRPANPASRLKPGLATSVVRRGDFVKLMGVVGVTAVIAFISALDKVNPSLASGEAEKSLDTRPGSITDTSPDTRADASTDASADTSATTQKPAGSAPVSLLPDTSNQTPDSCWVRCNRGCTYPGRCRRYQDSNNNNRCDLGECM